MSVIKNSLLLSHSEFISVYPKELVYKTLPVETLKQVQGDGTDMSI